MPAQLTHIFQLPTIPFHFPFFKKNDIIPLMTTALERTTHPETQEQSHVTVPTSVYLGGHRISNEEIVYYARRNNVTTDGGNPLTVEKIVQVTGILVRHEAAPYETHEYMAKKVLADLLQKAGTPDALVIASTDYSPQHLGRVLWEEIKNRGLVKEVPDLEKDPNAGMLVHGACAGGALAFTHLKNNEDYYKGKKVFVIAVENPTLPPLEKDPSFQKNIFSAAAAGMAVMYGEDFEVTKVLKPETFDDTKKRRLEIPQKHPRQEPYYEVQPIPQPNDKLQHMNGKEVYRWAIKEVPPYLKKLIEETNAKIVALHQANERITNSIAGRFSGLKFLNNIAYVGNTSSASILIALDEAIKKGEIKKGDEVAAVGFGGGLQIAGAVCKFI